MKTFETKQIENQHRKRQKSSKNFNQSQNKTKQLKKFIQNQN